MVQAIASFIDFCYLVRSPVVTEDMLQSIDKALENFLHCREIFRTSGVRPTGFSLPRQHSCLHYHHLIQQFGAPNGLCSSITESKHIHAVKKPWRRSNHYNALGQMLLTNQRMDKIVAMDVFLQHQQDIYNKRGRKKANQEEENDEDGDDDGLVAISEVTLAKTRGKCY